MSGAFLLGQFDALVLEVYDRWSSCAPADLIAHGLSVPFCKGYLVYVGAVFRNLALWWFQTTIKRQK